MKINQLILVFVFVMVQSLSASAQNFDPDAVVIEFQTGDGAQHTRSTNEILHEFSDGKDAAHHLFVLVSKLGIENEAVDYIVAQMPSAINTATGSVNREVIRSLGILTEKGHAKAKERLKVEMVDVLNKANEKDLQYYVQQYKILIGMQTEAIPLLQQIIIQRTDKSKIQRYAIKSLGKMDSGLLLQHPMPTDWLLPFSQSIKPNDDNPVRVASNLAKVWPNVSEAVKKNIPILFQSDNKFVRVLAIKFIKDRHITPEVPFSFVELIFKALVDPFAKVRSRAMETLLERNELEQYAIDYLLESIMNGNTPWERVHEHYRWSAFEDLQKVDAEGEYALEKLKRYYSDGYQRQRVYAVWAIGMLRSVVDGAKEELSSMQMVQDQQIAKTATEALDCLNARNCQFTRVMDGDYMFELYGGICGKSSCYVTIPGPEQFIMPDEPVVTYRALVRENPEDKESRSLNQILTDLSKEENYGRGGAYEDKLKVKKLNKIQREYILERLPSALDETTGHINWTIIDALVEISYSSYVDELEAKGQERLTREILDILDKGAHYSLKKAMDHIKYIKVDDEVIIEKLERIVYEESYPSDVHRAARFRLKADYGVEATRTDKFGRPLL